MSQEPITKEATSEGEPNEISLKSLQEEIEVLKLQLKKTTHLVAETGTQLLALQVEKNRGNLENLRVNTSASPKPVSQLIEEDPELANALTSEDVVDLVAELQGQLDILDERSVRRTANAFCTEDSQPIAPLPGRDGELPEESENFPRTLQEFKELPPERLQYWLKWYEILPPDEEEMKEILKRVGTSIEEVGYQAENDKQELSPQELDAYFDDFARFMGLRTRKSANVW
jgi:hypothetical protein